MIPPNDHENYCNDQTKQLVEKMISSLKEGNAFECRRLFEEIMAIKARLVLESKEVDVVGDMTEALNEVAATKKIIVRKGKRKVWWLCPKGYKKKQKGDKTCQPISGGEKTQRRRQAKRTARKAKFKQGRAKIRRQRSMNKRKGLGL